MTDPGERPHLVTVQRAAVTTDGHGGQTKTWSTHTTAWARLRYGTGRERREAAQENAAQPLTLECDWNPTLAAVQMDDRILLFDTAWDLTGKAIIGANREVHFTAIANLDAEVDS